MRQRKSFQKATQIPNKHRINEEITAREVMVVGPEGEQFGVMNTSAALLKAEELGVDLVEVAATAQPPVCKLLDYGKLKYREQKKIAEARKRTATHVIKELRLRYSTDDHDLETKLKKARQFLEDGDRVRFQMRFRGREVVYRDLGQKIFDEVAQRLEDLAAIEETSPLMGNKMSIVFAPRTAK